MNFKYIGILALTLVLAGCGAQTNTNVTADVATENSTSMMQEKAPVVRLTSPQEGQVLASPFLVGGEAQFADNTVHVRVTNTAGDSLIEETTLVKAENGEKGPFGVLINFAFQATDTGYVEVYGIDPTSGKEIGLSSVAVSFDISSSGSAGVAQ